MKYSIIFPIYNEEKNISSLYNRIKKVMDKLQKDYELIFINDGSLDRTRVFLEELHEKDKKVKIINFSRNFGHQIAVSAGLRYAKGDYMAVLDSDLQDPPEILPQFFIKLDEGYDAVYAIRKRRKENIIKKLCYSFFYRLLRTIANIAIPLDSGDFCVINRRVVNAINSLPERNRFVRGLRSWVGFRQIGIEYERDARLAGHTKYTFSRLIKLAFDGIFSFSYVPLQLMSYMGFIALVFSFIGILVAVYMKFFTTNYNRVPGFATTFILLMFTAGLQMFSLGIMGEYMRRIYDEIKQRPQYIIESAIGFGGK